MGDQRAARWLRRLVDRAVVPPAREGLQHLDGLLERACLCLQLLGSAGTLLGAGGVALRDLVHLRHGDAHLLDAQGLLLRRRGDLGDEPVRCRHLLHDLLQRRSHPVAAGGAPAAAGDRRLDLFSGLLCGGSTPLSQGSHLVGDHRETGASLPRAGRLDSGIEGQDVGLKRDLIDILHDLSHLRTRRLDRGHRLVHRPHRADTRLCRRAGLIGEGFGLVGVVRGAADHGRHLLQARAGLRHRRPLLAATFREQLARGRQLPRGQRRLGGPVLERRGEHPQRSLGRPDDHRTEQRPQQRRRGKSAANQPETGDHLVVGGGRRSLRKVDVVVDGVVEGRDARIECRIDPVSQGVAGGVDRPLTQAAE